MNRFFNQILLGRQAHLRHNTGTCIRRGSRLHLEELEDRTVPTLFLVAPAGLFERFISFTTLQAALTSPMVKAGDSIQIEPGSNPGEGTVGKSVTIQGDPAFGPATLPLTGNLEFATSSITLNNLNLSSSTVTLDNGSTSNTILNSDIASLLERNLGSASGDNLLSGNTFTQEMVLGGVRAFSMNERVVDNTFLVPKDGMSQPFFLSACTNALIQGNTFVFPANLAGVPPVALSLSDGQFTVIDNTIVTETSAIADLKGMEIEVDQGAATSVNLSGNRIGTGFRGIGIQLLKGFPLASLSVSLANNDLVQNLVGVEIDGDNSNTAAALGTIDLGGGPLGSAGGNNFHGFNSTANGRAAIETTNVGETAGAVVTAQNNIWNNNPVLSNVNNAAFGSSIIVTQPMTGSSIFVEQLFSDFLARNASASELSFWAPPVNSQSPGAVANGIIRSPEGLTQLVDTLYEKLLDRPEDLSGAAYWSSQIQQGSTLESVMTSFLTSPEFLVRANTVANTAGPASSNYVESLYAVLLGKQASASDLSFWVGQLALPAGNAGVASAFLATPEFRSDFAAALYSPTTLPPSSFFTGVPDLLHRPTPPGAGELAGWANSTLGLLSIEVAIAGSQEYFLNG